MQHLRKMCEQGWQPGEHTGQGCGRQGDRWRPGSHGEDSGGLTATKCPCWLKRNSVLKHPPPASSTRSRDWEMAGSFFSTLSVRAALCHNGGSCVSLRVSTCHCFLSWLVPGGEQPPSNGSYTPAPIDAIKTTLTKNRRECITAAVWEQKQMGGRGVPHSRCSVGTRGLAAAFRQF